MTTFFDICNIEFDIIDNKKVIEYDVFGNSNCSEECCVCLTTFHENQFITMQCNHKFCFKCVDELYKHNCNCPMCRSILHIEGENNSDELIDRNNLQISSEDRELLKKIVAKLDYNKYKEKCNFQVKCIRLLCPPCLPLSITQRKATALIEKRVNNDNTNKRMSAMGERAKIIYK